MSFALRMSVVVAGVAGIWGAVAACGDDDFSQRPVDAAPAIDAPVGDPCAGVTTACLLDRGTTQMENTRVAETDIANLMTDVLREEAAAVTGTPIDIAFINGGAIRGGANLGPPDFEWSSDGARVGGVYGPGPLSADDIRGWSPFRNDHTVFTATGAQLKRALEWGVSTFADDAQTTFGPDLLTADTGGWFLHPSGLDYDVTCPGTTRLRIGPPDCDPFEGTCMYLNAGAANSITRIAVGGETIYDAAAGGWQNGGDTAEYRVVMNSFIALGQDNHLDFAAGTERTDIAIDDWEYAEQLVLNLDANTPSTLDGDQGRITIIGQVGGLPCNLPASCTPAHAATHPNCQHL